MSDRRISRKELTNRNKKIAQRRKNIRALLIIAITAALVYITGLYGASLAYLGDFLSSGLAVFQIGDGWPLEGDFSAVLQGEEMGTGLCVLSGDNLTVYSPTGKNIFTYNHSMQNPVITTSGNRAVIYDLNQTALKVTNSHNVLFRQEMGAGIVHADISDSNRIAVTTRSSGYNGEVTVFNFNMSERFVWYCATGYPVYSSLSDSGKVMAVNTLKTEHGLIQSCIYLISVSGGEELYTITDGAYPLEMIFLSDSRLLIAYTDRLVLWDVKNNAQLSEYSYGTDSLLSVAQSGQYIALATGSYADEADSRISLLSLDLTEKYKVSVSEPIKDLSVSNSRVYALGRENLYEFDYSMTQVNKTETGPLSKMLVEYNGTTLITSTGISRLEKTKSR